MKSEYIPKEVYELLLVNMRPENALIMRVCLETGMRVGDAVALKREALSAKEGQFYITYTAKKTNKVGVARISGGLFDELFLRDGEWLFPSRDGNGHRSRQAVWRDVRSTSKRLCLPMHVTPHSARKTFAVELTARKGIEATMEALQHDRISTTALYYAYSNRGLYDGAELRDEDVEKIAVKVADILAKKLGIS